MSITVASWIWSLIGIYLGLGVLFAILFLSLRLKKSDPDANGSSIGFRAIVLPGIILLWPALARRWIAGITTPHEEKSPHRV
ncbi:MAG: hypothetical protein AB8G77_19665 [Rhodothermales bacterium]